MSGLFRCLHSEKGDALGRLKSLARRLGSLGARVSIFKREDLERARDQRRDREEATRALYKTARWKRLRLAILRA
jgi:5-methylcytosine-specific restriction enzyme A